MEKNQEEEWQELSNRAETLKEEIWEYLDKYKIEHKGLKESVNEMLDLVDEVCPENGD